MKALIFLIIFLPTTALAGDDYVFRDWTKQDIALQATASLLHVADWMQTREIASNNEYIELNPILGEHPSQSEVNWFMGGMILGGWIVSDLLPPKWRRYYQMLYIGSEAATVAHNYNAGVTFKF